MTAETTEVQLPTLETSENGGGSTAPGPHVKHRGWKAMPYVIGNETFEKLGSIGIGSNLLIYLTTVFHMKSVTAATAINVFTGTTNLATVLGAFVSDTYLGRYKTVGIGCVASLVGMFLLTLTAAFPTLHPPKCPQGEPCDGATAGQLAFLVTAFGFMVIGAGGIRPCNLAFGADQFDPNTESGKRGINSFFNWYYFTFTISVTVCSTVIIYVQNDVSWTAGLAVPTALMFLSCVFFFVGSKIYVKVKPEGSPFTSIANVFVSAFAKRRLKLPDDPKQSLFNPPHLSLVVSKLPYTDQFRFLAKAGIVRAANEVQPNGFAAKGSRLCSIQQVEEVKCLIRIIPVWCACIIYYIAMAQQQTYAILQAVQSERHIGRRGFEIPAASFSIFPMLALTIWIPVYDRLLVPWLRKLTGKEGGITLLQRMGIGIILSILAVTVSAWVEERRRREALRSGSLESPMPAFWLIPQLSFFGLSEAFTLVGQLEFYYRQFPENMRSVAGALLFCGIALANYLSGMIVTVVNRVTGSGGKDSWLAGDLNKGRLDWFYFLIAVIGSLNFFFFLACAKWYRYKGLDDSAETARGSNKSKASPV